MEGMLSRVVSQITLNTAYIFNDAALQSQTYGTGVASQPVHNVFSYETRMAASKRPEKQRQQSLIALLKYVYKEQKGNNFLSGLVARGPQKDLPLDTMIQSLNTLGDLEAMCRSANPFLTADDLHYGLQSGGNDEVSLSVTKCLLSQLASEPIIGLPA